MTPVLPSPAYWRLAAVNEIQRCRYSCVPWTKCVCSTCIEKRAATETLA